MAKYIAIASLIAVMAATISIIDAKSSGFGGIVTPSADVPASTERLYASGIVEGSTDDVHLRSEQAGRVTEVLVKEGQWVEAGEVLLRLDKTRQLQEVALATANVELAQAQLEKLNNGARAEEREEAHALYRAARFRLEQALRNWKRIEQLRSQQAVSDQEAEDQQSQVDTLRAQLDAAEARVRLIEAPARADEVRSATAHIAAALAECNLAQIALAKTELRAASRGRVLKINVEPGELTSPNAAVPLIVLSDTSIMRVRAFVEELDAPRVEIGMPATVTADGLPSAAFRGQIVSISPCMAPKLLDTGRPNELYDMKIRQVVVELDSNDQLIVGLRVDVLINAGHCPNAEATGPSSANFFKQPMPLK